MNILITGPTGNIGSQLIRTLLAPQPQSGSQPDHAFFAAVRDTGKASKTFAGVSGLRLREFDYDDPQTFDAALEGIGIVFLLRPPHISDIAKYYTPLFDSIKRNGISKVVLLSVQGAEKSSVIPHRKIELLILDYGFEYIFVRPAYFMQNLTTTLLPDIKKHRAIVLPAGNAKFNWIDIANIAELCAVCLVNFEQYKNRAYEVTGDENLDFSHAVSRINAIAGCNIEYRPVSPLYFIVFELLNGMKFGMILVMCMLHYLPRLQKEPEKSDVYTRMLGRRPDTLDSFITANRDFFV